MKITVPADEVYDCERVPTYEWETYQRGFLGILNNSYNQSCNAGTPKLGQMNDIEQSFVSDTGGGSWMDFVRYYIREKNGANRVARSIEAMTENLMNRVSAIGGSVPEEDARYWSRMYIWSMIANTYSGFCSERTAIGMVASRLGIPYETNGDESNGIDGSIGNATVQVKPESYMGLDLNDHDADYVIEYEYADDEFVFDVPDELTQQY